MEDTDEDVQYVVHDDRRRLRQADPHQRLPPHQPRHQGRQGDVAGERGARACWCGAFIVEDGDEVLSITQGGQVVRSRIDENFRVMGRSTMGVKFVTPKEGDAVAVVARAVEATADDAGEATEATDGGDASVEPADTADAADTGDTGDTAADGSESADVEVDATIEDDDTSQ